MYTAGLLFTFLIFFFFLSPLLIFFLSFLSKPAVRDKDMPGKIFTLCGYKLWRHLRTFVVEKVSDLYVIEGAGV